MRSARRTQKSRTWQSKFIKASCTLLPGPFTDLLVIGIGGSALGPQFVGKALGHPCRDKLAVHFLRQYRSRRDRPDSSRNRAKACHDPCLGHLQIGRYPRDQKWNVGGRKGIFRPMGWISPNKQLQLPEKGGFTNTPSGMAGWISSRCGTGWAEERAKPQPSDCCPPLFRASASTNSSKGEANGRNNPPR